jgi:heptosyltransferase-3
MVPDAISSPSLRRALVIKLRHHGDVLLTSPVFSTLRQLVPGIEVDALIYDDTAEMLSHNPDVSRLFTVPRKGRQLSLPAQMRQEWQLFATLRERRYDLLVHLTESWRGAWLAKALRPRLAVAGVSPLRPPPRLWARSFTHLAPNPPLGGRHTIERHLDALRAIGLQPPAPRQPLRFVPGAEADARIAGLLAGHAVDRSRLIHIHPTSRWMFKAWTVEGYAATIAGLIARGYRVVMTAAPAEKEMPVAAAIKAQCDPGLIDLSGQLSLKELGAVIGAARLSLCVDSVPMHMAAAMGTPVVALFGPSSEAEWGPWQVPHRIIVSGHSCRPCRLDGCGGGKVSDCLVSLSPAEVLAAADSLLA